MASAGVTGITRSPSGDLPSWPWDSWDPGRKAITVDLKKPARETEALSRKEKPWRSI